MLQNNLPAQIELYAIDGDEYHFLFMAKGGGSANTSRLNPGGQRSRHRCGSVVKMRIWMLL